MPSSGPDAEDYKDDEDTVLVLRRSLSGSDGGGNDTSTGPRGRGQQRREGGSGSCQVLLEGQDGLTILVFLEHFQHARHHLSAYMY